VPWVRERVSRPPVIADDTAHSHVGWLLRRDDAQSVAVLVARAWQDRVSALEARVAEREAARQS
jgi:hypothetical protein